MFLALLGKVSPSLWSPGSIPAQGWRGRGGCVWSFFQEQVFRRAGWLVLAEGRVRTSGTGSPGLIISKLAWASRGGGGTLMGGVLGSAGSVAHPVY